MITEVHTAAQDNCTITPVISKSSADFIEGLVKDAEGKGAKLMQKYRREGNLIWPLLVDHVTPVRPRPAFFLLMSHAASILHQDAGPCFMVVLYSHSL